MLSPFFVMLALIAVTAVAAWGGAVIRARRGARVAALAATWRMSYTAGDRFNLTPRVAAQFPIPGAADVVVRDLIYGSADDVAGGGGLRYFFTVEYTTGVLRTKRRRVGVAMLVERDGAATAAAATTPAPAVTLAPPALPLVDQYGRLRDHAGGAAVRA